MVIYIAGKSKKKIIIDVRHFVKIIMYTQEVLNIYKDQWKNIGLIVTVDLTICIINPSSSFYWKPFTSKLIKYYFRKGTIVTLYGFPIFFFIVRTVTNKRN